MKAASLLGSRVGRLILLEPNPFYLLKQNGCTEAYQESRDLRDHVKCYGALSDWPKVAERFADYWLGDGSMPEKRRVAFADSLPPNFYEWDAVMEEKSTIEDCKNLNPPALMVSDATTRLPIREIVALFAKACPHWTFHTIPDGGHMGPLTRPELINPVVQQFLDAGQE